MPDDADVKPTPDPTTLSTQAVARAVSAERDYVDGQIAVLRERLNGMDRAATVLNETVTRVPTDVQKEVAHSRELVIHLRELALEKFNSVQTQFQERDTQSERESKNNKVAVDAAFAAADKAADERNKSNMLAIAKSESAMAETVNKLTELFRTTNDGLSTMITSNTRALSDKIEDAKDLINKLEIRIGKIENLKLGAAEQTHSSQNSISQFLAVIGAVVAVVSIAVAIMIATRGGGA